jgi:hypothetical protein
MGDPLLVTNDAMVEEAIGQHAYKVMETYQSCFTVFACQRHKHAFLAMLLAG